MNTQSLSALAVKRRMKISALALGLLLIAGLVWYKQAGAAAYSKPTTLFTTITVNSTVDGPLPTLAGNGTCDLREAIAAANGHGTVGQCMTGDSITFNIGVGTPTINITSALPDITVPLMIDGATGGATRVELNGAGTSAGVNGLAVTAGSSTIKSLVINRFGENGLLLKTGGSNNVRDCFLGTNSAGAGSLPNGKAGVRIENSASNIVGGTTAALRNIISGNSNVGVEMLGATTTGNIVEGNYIGTNAAGTAALPNANGGVYVVITGANNMIGVPGAGNLISGNNSFGVRLGITSGNKVQGNMIGTTLTGLVALPNASGVELTNNADNNLIGGTAAGARNFISGNTGNGVTIFNTSVGNNVQGNFIGTDLNGTAALPNGAAGISIESGSSGNTIGGATVPERNIISGNGQNDVIIDGSSATGNVVQGNYIGTNAAGTAKLSNGNGGVAAFNGANNTNILNNVIAGHEHGVDIAFGTNNCVVRGNLIGTDWTGAVSLGNSAVGVLININSNNNTVGGTTASDRNLISANSGGGVAIGSNSTGNTVLGNFIGTNAAGTAGISNGLQGVVLIDSPNNTIGGTVAGAGNLIAFNSQKGIDLVGTTTTGNRLLGNLIFSNGALGIDLNDDGVTTNDAGDGDIGPNKRQNFPVLTQVFPNLIKGTLNSTANTPFIIQFFSNPACDASGNGEGQTYLGQTTVTTDGSGNATTISFTPIPSLSPGVVVTATATTDSAATDPNNTSEFSACQVVTPCPTITLTPSQLPGGSVGVGYAQTLTASGGCSPYTFSVSAGFLPPGLTLSSSGLLSGTPSQCGSFTATIKVTDNCGCTLEQNYPLMILSTPRTYRAGNMDSFMPPNDPAYPSVALKASFPTATWKNFDDTSNDKWVGHTFLGLPANIVKAVLEVQMKPGTGDSSNDSINLTFAPNPPTVVWGIHMADIATGLNWNPGHGAQSFTLNLASLPPSGAQPTNLIPTLAARRYLDVVIQDDTTVDYMKLRVWTCPPRPYFFGLPHDVLGQAQLSGGANGSLIASNLGSSGEDGVSLELGEAEGFTWVVEMPDSMPIGAVFTGQGRGQIDGVANQPAGTQGVMCVADGLQILAPDFSPSGSPTYQMKLYLNGAVVYSQSGMTGSPGVLLAGSKPKRCHCDGWHWYWIIGKLDNDAALMQVTNGPAVMADKVTFDAEAGATHHLDYLSSISARATGFSTFTIAEEAVTAFSLDHHSLGSATLEPFSVNLTIANIGSSGQDGVMIDLGKTDSFDFGLDPIDLMGTAPVGAFLQAEAFGSRNGLLNHSLGKLQATKTAADYQFTADFSAIGSTTQHIQIFNGATLIIDLPLHTGPVGNSSSWPRRIGKLGGQLECFTSDFDPGSTFRIGGTPYPITQLRVLAEGATGTIEFKSGLALRGSGIGEFTLTSGDIFCPPVINVLPQTLQPGTTGVSYPLVQFSTSTSLDPFTYTVTGSLPNGMTLTADGKLSGVPHQAGSFNFVVRAENQQGCFGEQPYTLVIICPTITINPATPTLPAGTAGTPYNQPLTQTGGAAPVAWSISAGLLPPGVTLNPTTGLLSGTPTGFGIFTFTVKVTDAYGCIGTQAYTLTISCPSGTVTVNPATLPNGVVGTAYNQTLTATGGSSPYTFTVSAGTAPTGVTLSLGGVLSGVATAAGTFNFTVKATDTNGCIGTRSYTVIISGNVSNGLQFYPLPRPVRLLDTRAGQGNCDSVSTPIAAGTSLTTLARITCESITIPATAQAVVGNLTVLNQTTQTGYLTIYPDGVPAPLAANMIYGPGAILSNNFTVGLSADGKFNVFGERTIDVVVDISGYYAPPGAGGLYYHPLSKPVRLLDTRPGQGNCDSIGTPIPAGTSLTTLARTTCETVTIPTTAQAIVGNATVINGSGQTGYLTIYPNGVPAPLAANIIYFPGQVLSNAFTTSLSASGEFNIFGERTIDIAVDVAGYYSTEANDVNGVGLLFTPLSRPLRIMDTRANQGNCDNVGTPIAAGTSIAVPARITCESITIPAVAQTVIGTVTVINSNPTAGYMTMYADGVPQPLAANMVYFPGQILSNAFVVGLNTTSGQFRIFGERTLEAIVDVSGYFAP